MRSFYIIIIIIIFFTAQINAQTPPSAGKPVTLENTEQFSIKSKFVEGENYVIQVSLPVNYLTYDYSFPVLYVLDGDKSFGMTKEIADWLMWFAEIRDIVIVGISYGQGTDDWWVKRERDYTHSTDPTSATETGGADNFLKFIKNELFPAVSKRYRVNQNLASLMGISYGGMLTSYALFSQPSMFHGYIIIGPTLIWNNKSILRMETNYSNNNKALNKSVYIAYGSLDDKAWVKNPTSEFINSIQQHNYEGLRFKSQELEGETHISAYSTALTHGLKFLYSH